MIYVTGDMHGSRQKLKAAAARLKKGDTLIIAGDFGFIWNGSKAETKELARLGRAKYNLCFLDGSNENHELLAALPVTDFAGAAASNVSGNLWYLRRGEVYTIEDKTIFTFGGAKSDDIESKQQYGNWYSGELPTEEELRNGVENLEKHGYKVDYIITHQPSAATLASMEAGYVDCDNLQIFLDEVAKRTEYSMWVFGRMHRDRKVTYKLTAVFDDVIPLNPPPRHARIKSPNPPKKQKNRE